MNPIKKIILGATLVAGSLEGQSQIGNPASSMWNEPTFIKSFVGSYGFLAGYEPTIDDEEKESLRALISLIKSNPNVAIQQLETLVKQSESAAFEFILANLYAQEGDLMRAERYYQSAVSKYPQFRRAYKNLGLVQVQSGNWDAAIKSISKSLELGEVDGRVYGLLGYGYLTKGLYYPAEVAYRQAILMQPEVEDWKVGLARCLLETQNYSDAIALFDTLLQESPNNKDYWLLQSNAYIGKGEPLAAAQNLEIVRRMGGAELATLMLLGDIYMNNETPDLALAAYLAGVEKASTDDSQVLIRTAQLFTRSGNYDQAKIMIERTRNRLGEGITESNELDLLTLDAKIARVEGDDATAVAALNLIVERQALNGEALIELANYYADQGELAKATVRYEQAAKIDAYERPALVAHAQTLVRSGDYKNAVPMLQRALRLQPDSKLQDYLQRVERAAKRER